MNYMSESVMDTATATCALEDVPLSAVIDTTSMNLSEAICIFDFLDNDNDTLDALRIQFATIKINRINCLLFDDVIWIAAPFSRIFEMHYRNIFPSVLNYRPSFEPVADSSTQ